MHKLAHVRVEVGVKARPGRLMEAVFMLELLGVHVVRLTVPRAHRILRTWVTWMASSAYLLELTLLLGEGADEALHRVAVGAAARRHQVLQHRWEGMASLSVQLTRRHN